MITDVVIVPGAPLLLPEYQGRVAAAPEVMDACVAAVRDAVMHAAHVVVVHATDREPRSSKPAVGLRVADHLLAATHLGFEVEHVAVAWDASVEECVAIGERVADSGTPPPGEKRGVFAPPREAGDAASPSTPAGAASGVTLLVVADGSARRTEKAPGHLDPRAAALDEAIVSAIRASGSGGLSALLDLDPALCADLLVAGRAPLQVLASAVGERPLRVEACEVTDPFGVLYVVAHLATPN